MMGFQLHLNHRWSCLNFYHTLSAPYFSYCKYRLVSYGWGIREYGHFTPAIVIILLYTITYNAEAQVPKSDSEEIVLFLLFVMQLLGYSFAAFFIVVSKTRYSNPTMQQKFHAAFLKPLVVASVVLFTYSFLHSLIPVFKESFIMSIQVMIGILIVIIAFLNAEKLEKHIEAK